MNKFVKLLTFFLLALPLFAFTAKADSGTGTTFEVTKAVAPATAAPNGTLTYSITIKNISETNAAPLTVRDTMPEGFSYSNNAKLTKIDGTQVDFAPATAGQVLTWTFDGDTLQSIPQNQTVVISYSLTAPATTGEYTNQACLVTPEEVCATANVTITTTPNTGILDNIFIFIAVGGLLILASLKIPRLNMSLEEKIIKN
jgi:fimbrial isopeptide formation D2 family protein